MNVQEIVNNRYGKGIAQCSNEEIYYALLEMTKSMAKEKESNEGKRKLYYISAEFLIGKLLSNNLINLGIYEEVKQVLAENGKNLAEIEEVEPEPSLGNGGLGRLAACFLDSIATLGLNGDGVGLNYHYGLFKQVFEHNLQHEEPNPWIEKESWLTKTNVTYPVQFGGFTLQSRLYDIDVIGFENRTTKLHLFDVETVDESLVGDGINFDKEDIAKNLTLFLYPDDSDDKGRILRVYQQYFMVSNAAQLIIDETLARGGDLHKLDEYAAIQINDTHPSMVIPELIRLLMQRGILMDEAIVPVCTPNYARQHQLTQHPDNLRHCTLLHDRQAWSNDSGTDEWYSWAQKFAVELPPSSGIGFDRSDLAVIAAMNHVGVAMGRKRLVQKRLDSGELIAPFGDMTLKCHQHYYVTTLPGRQWPKICSPDCKL